jgi:hypothetical protein
VSFPDITDLKQLCCAFSTTFIAFFTPLPRLFRQFASPLGMAPAGSAGVTANRKANPMAILEALIDTSNGRACTEPSQEPAARAG